MTSNLNPVPTAHPVAPSASTALKVLLVDDSKLQRRLLSMTLRKRGFQVLEAESAEDGFALFQSSPVDIVISDWVMPGMSGPAFCRKLREHSPDHYIYIILLTAKSGANEIAEGFEAGADDFLSKPVNATELAARMSAGQRILHFERELKRANTLLSDTLSELRSLYHAMDSDLAEARELQQSLVREKKGSFGSVKVAIFLESSGHVGGDLVGFFGINPRELCIFAVDVSGHGVSSALMTARLAGTFAGTTPGKNIAIGAGPNGEPIARDPSDVAADLNRLLLEEMETEHYFTLFLCVLDVTTGSLRFVQAGHPNAVVMRQDGGWQLLGDGGFPIGMLAQAAYETGTGRLGPGDRLLLCSDGMTECVNDAGDMLDEDGLAQMASGLKPAAPEVFLTDLHAELVRFAGRTRFDDDVSAVLLQFD